MFTVKQETDNGHKMWPGINHVYTSADTPYGTDAVYGLFKAGGDLQFHASTSHHMIYVMNESGATVARYDLGNRPPSTISQTLGGACAPDPANPAA